MKTAITLLALIHLLFSVALHADSTGLPSTLRIGTTASYPPLAFMQDGRFSGMEADMAAALQGRLGINTRVIILARDELIPALLNEKIDIIMSGMSVTEERSKQIRFTDPYMEVGQMALIRSEQLVQWSQPRALYADGVRVGVIENTTGAAFANDHLKAARVTQFTDIDAATRALAENDIDLFVHDAPTIWRLSAQNKTRQAGLMGLYRPLTDEYLAWAVRPADTQLADTLNTQIAVMRKDGTVGRITRRWIPVSVRVGN